MLLTAMHCRTGIRTRGQQGGFVFWILNPTQEQLDLLSVDQDWSNRCVRVTVVFAYVSCVLACTRVLRVRRCVGAFTYACAWMRACVRARAW